MSWELTDVVIHPPKQENPLLTQGWKPLIRVAVSGAAGSISNHLLFMVSNLSSAKPLAYLASVEMPQVVTQNEFYAVPDCLR